jgi:hypothetical protein
MTIAHDDDDDDEVSKCSNFNATFIINEFSWQRYFENVWMPLCESSLFYECVQTQVVCLQNSLFVQIDSTNSEEL